MPKWNRKFLVIFGFIFLIIFILIGMSKPTQAARMPECGIRIDDVHFSTSLARLGKGRVIKANAYSHCSQLHKHVRLRVKIRKTGLFWDHTVADVTTNPDETHMAVFDVKNEKTLAICINNRATNYYALAQSSAEVNGKTLSTEWAHSEHTVLLQCGT